jgi:predicted amidohydrolase
MIVDPLGEIKSKTEDDPAILYGEINMKYLEEIRERVIIFENRRTDLYSTILKKEF